MPAPIANVTLRPTENTRAVRKRQNVDVGRLGHANVLASPAPLLTDAEWQCILNARESYQHMWGGGARLFQGIKEDPFDGRGQFANWYRTTHYIGLIVTPGKPDKLITMRRVAINRQVLAEGAAAQNPAIFNDLAFWCVRDYRLPGLDIPLAVTVKNYLECQLGLGPFPSAVHLPIAALSRAGTLPYESSGTRDPDDRNRSAVLYALIQVAAAQDDFENVLYCAQICEEFRASVFALHLPTGERIELAYPYAVDTLKLSRDRYRVVLDRSDGSVRHTMRSFPGFWLDNASFASVLTALVREGLLTVKHLRRAAFHICLNNDAGQLASRDAGLVYRLARGEPTAADELERMAVLVARPRLAKYMAPVIWQDRPISRRVFAEVDDGPYSVVVEPHQLLASALHMLDTARGMYA